MDWIAIYSVWMLRQKGTGLEWKHATLTTTKHENLLRRRVMGKHSPWHYKMLFFFLTMESASTFGEFRSTKGSLSERLWEKATRTGIPIMNLDQRIEVEVSMMTLMTRLWPAIIPIHMWLFLMYTSPKCHPTSSNKMPHFFYLKPLLTGVKVELWEDSLQSWYYQVEEMVSVCYICVRCTVLHMLDNNTFSKCKCPPVSSMHYNIVSQSHITMKQQHGSICDNDVTIVLALLFIPMNTYVYTHVRWQYL